MWTKADMRVSLFFLILCFSGCFTRQEIDYYKERAYKQGYSQGMTDCIKIQDANDEEVTIQ